MSYGDELGSGNVEYRRDRNIIHFGSPVGSTWEKTEDEDHVKYNISVKEWLEKNG